MEEENEGNIKVLKFDNKFGFLLPREPVVTNEGELSARGTQHRVRSSFDNMIKESTLILEKSDRDYDLPGKSQSRRLLYTNLSRAYAYHRLEEYGKAMHDYTLCISRDPSWDLPYYNRACLHYQMRNLQRAVDDLNRAIERNSRELCYLRNRAMVLREMGKYREATNDYKTLREAGDLVIERQMKEDGESKYTMEEIHLYSVLRSDKRKRTGDQITRCLKTAPFISYFKKLPDETLYCLIQKGFLHTFRKGSHIVTQGDPAQMFFVILQGSVSVVRENRDDDGSYINEDCVKKLYKGDAFGEPSRAICDRFRGASVVCTQDTKCLGLNYQLYGQVLGHYQETIIRRQMEFLASCRLFTGDIEDKDQVLRRVAECARVVTYDPGQVLLNAGDPVKSLYIVSSGVCCATKKLTLPRNTIYRNQRRRGGVMQKAERRTNRMGFHETKNNAELEQTLKKLSKQSFVDEKRSQKTEITVATLVTGQMFGETCILHPGTLSQVTISSITMTEILVFTATDLTKLNIKFYTGTVNALQESMMFHCPSDHRLLELHRERAKWNSNKSKIIKDVLRKRMSDD